MKFRKKPVIIEAEQFCLSDWQKLETWGNGAIVAIGDRDNDSGKWIPKAINIHTLEGDVLNAEEGDWIIKGIKNEFYPCKPDIFAQTYEPV